MSVATVDDAGFRDEGGYAPLETCSLATLHVPIPAQLVTVAAGGCVQSGTSLSTSVGARRCGALILCLRSHFAIPTECGRVQELRWDPLRCEWDVVCVPRCSLSQPPFPRSKMSTVLIGSGKVLH